MCTPTQGSRKALSWRSRSTLHRIFGFKAVPIKDFQPFDAELTPKFSLFYDYIYNMQVERYIRKVHYGARAWPRLWKLWESPSLRGRRRDRISSIHTERNPSRTTSSTCCSSEIFPSTVSVRISHLKSTASRHKCPQTCGERGLYRLGSRFYQSRTRFNQRFPLGGSQTPVPL